MNKRCMNSRHLRLAMMALTAAAVIAATACEHSAAPYAQARQPDTTHIALYNRGTTLLQHDSLIAALPRLDSAMISQDSTVVFRSAFNSGWDHLVNAIRTFESIKKGGAKVSSALTGTPSSYVREQIDSALVKYRNALVRNPDDLDTKWNYELALQYASRLQNEKSEKAERQKTGAPKQQKGTPDEEPSARKLGLPLQQAEQLLNTIGKHEQQSAKSLPVPTTPPQGKDW